MVDEARIMPHPFLKQDAKGLFIGGRYHAALSGRSIENSFPGIVTTMTVKAPIGVVGARNGPLISQWFVLGPALATGCTVVMKPAEDAST